MEQTISPHSEKPVSPVRVEAPFVARVGRAQNNEPCLGRNMSQRFKRKQKYSDKLSKDVNEDLKIFEKVCLDFKSSNVQLM